MHIGMFAVVISAMTSSYQFASQDALQTYYT